VCASLPMTAPLSRGRSCAGWPGGSYLSRSPAERLRRGREARDRTLVPQRPVFDSRPAHTFFVEDTHTYMTNTTQACQTTVMLAAKPAADPRDRVFITVLTTGFIKGRNGTTDLSAVQVWQGTGNVWFDGLGKRGFKINEAWVFRLRRWTRPRPAGCRHAAGRRGSRRRQMRPVASRRGRRRMAERGGGAA
jgi:hypothetical protein